MTPPALGSHRAAGTEHHLDRPAQPSGRSPTPATILATTSPEVVADLVIGEILGWDACRHPPVQLALQAMITLRGFAPGPSVHAVLDDGLHRLASGDADALSPRPDLDSVLHRLVRLVTRRFGADTTPPAARDRFHLDVVSQVFDRLGRDAELAARAATVRRGSAAAEGAMERHYCRLTLDALDQTGPGQQALDQIEAGPSRTRRLDALRSVLESFPYVRNYEFLTLAELAGLQAAGHPVSSRSSVAFCGAGPLPLTGILVHVLTGAQVTLVEIDVEAAALAQRLLDHLARYGVVDYGSVNVLLGDAAGVDLGRPDVVVVASLVGSGATLGLVSNLGRDQPHHGTARRCLVPSSRSSPVLVVRSAAGLVGQFAYAPILLDTLTALGWRHLGEVTPLTSVTFANQPTDRTLAVPIDSPSLLAVAPSEVLNRTELLELMDL